MSLPSKSAEVRLADYVVPAFLIDTTDLDFDIRGSKVTVASQLAMYRNPAHKDKKAPLVLDGEFQTFVSIAVNGKKLTPSEYKLTDEHLIVAHMPDVAIVQVVSWHEPAKNKALSGLYAAGKMLSTQNEPEGFRRITYYPDRSDVLSSFTVTIHADKKLYPVLLSNGNLIAMGSEKDGRHWVRWEDPFRKPCYLFALVAGKLDCVQDHFKTKSGRKVLIEMYVEPGKKKETGFALAAIKNAMKWDEQRFGLEYDLKRFMLVAVSFFNMGAMENKGLNIFNDSCVLGRAETAPDHYIAFIERVVGHEYCHNWTGDRVTCRDWFQLSLKEGLTVFREQEFCGAMSSPELERLRTVAILRRAQFPEDAGAMAHPIRPATYQAIDNFYTATVYEKGAEVCRMIQTLVGKKGFEKGLSLYIKRHDGTAATCEDFVKAQADANKIDLKHFLLWYSQAGTPVLTVKSAYNEKKKTFALEIRQKTKPTPGQPKKLPLHIPFAMGLLDEKGRDLIGTKVLSLHKEREKFVFKNIKSKPVPSLLRNFSAPVILNYATTDAELLFLMAHDTDAFNRWEAGQKLFMKYILKQPKKLPPAMVDALRQVLCDAKLDEATKAISLSIPTEAEVGLALKGKGQLIDPVAVYQARQNLVRLIAKSLQEELWMTFVDIEATLDEKASDGVARGRRSLKNLCLSYLGKEVPHDVAPVAAAQVAGSANMTDQTTGLDILTDIGGKLSKEMLRLFEKRYLGNPNIMDSWLSTQASARRKGVLADVKKLMKHKAFRLDNPNRVSALIGVFAGNPFGFHAADGSGYRFVADVLIKLDPLNPLAAGRLGKSFLRWKDYDKKRQALMKAQLRRLAKQKKLSPNLREVVSKSLKG
jgi:aminopeptidase N